MAETEAQLVKKMIKALRKLPKTEASKIHGDPYQERGIPDIMGSHKGHAFTIEAKRPGKENEGEVAVKGFDQIFAFDKRVRFCALIDEKGNVVQTKLLQSVGFGLDDVIIETLRRWRYQPAKVDGVPVSSKHDVHFHFPG